MNFSILLPHWKTGKMSAYAVYKLLENQGRHNIDIHVIDNNAGDGTVEYLAPFGDQIRIWDYPKHLLQSHGISFDYILPYIQNEWIITTESDSFPTSTGWLNYFEALIAEGVDCAGSLLDLSGGSYVHPCGMLFRKKSWQQARDYCDQIPYSYFPNMAMKEGFACHLMVRNDILNDFLDMPEDYIELAKEYLPFSKEMALGKRDWYKPVVGPFHNGMGGNQESVKTYGQRSILTETSRIIDPKVGIIKRIGFEPGQWFSYWHYATGKKVDFIPTKTVWMNDKPGTQQEYTYMENGFKHLWGISAWKDADPANEIARIKQSIPDDLYETLPEKYKLK